MILSRKTIKKEISDGNLSITPNPIFKQASVKAHLSDLFGETKDNFIQKNFFKLKPKGFILCKTKEILSLPKDIAAFYDGYVGVATKGLFTHGGSMFIDPGEESQITLEIFNASDKVIILEKDMRVGQYIFMKVT